MNTDLSPEISRTCSNTHGKIANNNNFRFRRNNIRLQCLELSNNMLQELNRENYCDCVPVLSDEHLSRESRKLTVMMRQELVSCSRSQIGRDFLHFMRGIGFPD